MICRFLTMATVLLGLGSMDTWAWGNHSLPAYRALENMPQVAQAAPVRVESLDAFLKAEETGIAALLQEQEAWASSHLDYYPPRPAVLAFHANRDQTDPARRLAFLRALRIAQNSRFALYVQPDLQAAPGNASPLPYASVNPLPEPAHTTHRFVSLQPGQMVSALQVVASASDEPDYGLDINLWSDSPGTWGKEYGFGPLSFGNPAISYTTQSPFHMGFLHEDRLIYWAAPFLKKTFPLWRIHQYSGLAVLAWRTGHAYWGWRFAGLALHYVQDLTQPYHASISPGDGTMSLIGTNALAMLGMPRKKNELVVLLSNRHLALEKYQTQLLVYAAAQHQDTKVIQALRDPQQDAQYPPWSEDYTRDVVSAEAYAAGADLSQTLVATLPAHYVSDPAFDFGVQEAQIDLMAQVGSPGNAKRDQLDTKAAQLLAHFGAHSRNTLRGLLAVAAANKP